VIVAGIDPSLTGTGIAIIANGVPAKPICIKTDGRADANDVQRVRRVFAILAEIKRQINPHNPDLVLIESPAISQKLPSTVDRNFLWGCIVHEFAVAQKRRYARITPTGRAQFAAGNGHASKEAVIDAVNGWWPHLNLRTTPPSRMQDNEADAIVVATMGVAYFEPELLPFELAPHQRNNLEAVAWPVMS
jgi:Holliday junction resolvasome RuvABC endonuclease subunit